MGHEPKRCEQLELALLFDKHLSINTLTRYLGRKLNMHAHTSRDSTTPYPVDSENRRNDRNGKLLQDHG